jgi:hypothetical protein
MEKIKSGNGLVQAIRTINIKVTYMIAKVWDENLFTTFFKFWKNAWLNMQQDANFDTEKSGEPDVEVTDTAD